MEFDPYPALREQAQSSGISSAWLEAVTTEAERRLAACPHGDYPRWRQALEALPLQEGLAELDGATPRLGAPARDRSQVREALMALHPWRKGPLEIAGVAIDTEWRSDWKWARIAPHLELAGAKVVDIGCGNGYYGWRMLGAGADLVIGIDPTWVFVMQWLACRHFAGDVPNYVLPLGIEDLPAQSANFDVVCSMGVLYHRRDPGRHLRRLHGLVRPGGKLVLETLVLPDSDPDGELRPAGRYARMRNVWSVPGRERLVEWVRGAGFEDLRVVDVATTTPAEQRTTPWMRFESLDRALDPADPDLTIEGHPAPRRAALIASRRS